MLGAYIDAAWPVFMQTSADIAGRIRRADRRSAESEPLETGGWRLAIADGGRLAPKIEISEWPR